MPTIRVIAGETPDLFNPARMNRAKRLIQDAMRKLTPLEASVILGAAVQALASHTTNPTQFTKDFCEELQHNVQQRLKVRH
jgi:hypothetical protein